MLTRTTNFDYSAGVSVQNHNASTGAMSIRFVHNAATYIAAHRLRLDMVQIGKVEATNQTAQDVANIKAKTDQLQFTNTSGNSTVKSHVYVTENIDFSATQKTSLNSAAPVVPTVVQMRQEMDSNSTQFAAIKAQTDKLEFTNESGHNNVNAHTKVSDVQGGLTAQETVNAVATLAPVGTPASGSLFDKVNSMPASVWAYSTRTLSSFGTLVADIATAVWSATTRTITAGGTTAQQVWEYATRTITSGGITVGEIWGDNEVYEPGTKGDQLANAGSAGNPWSDTQTYVPGTKGYQIDQLGSGSVTLTSPFTSEVSIELVRGDDYNNLDGRAMLYTFSDVPDISTATVVFKVKNIDGLIVSKNLTVLNASQARLELESAKTVLLNVGELKYDIEITYSNGRKITPVCRSKLTVFADIA